MKTKLFCTALIFMTICFLSQPTLATTATKLEMEQVCSNWLSFFIHENGDWAGASNPEIIDSESIEYNGQYLGQCFNISPVGYIAVPILKELPPVVACSEKNGMDLNLQGGSPLLLKELLYDRVLKYIETYGSLDALQPETGIILFEGNHEDQWLTFADTAYQDNLDNGSTGQLTQVGPLLTSSWHQREPYNGFALAGDGGDCVVGCVAIASAQIMNYHNYPVSGHGSVTYNWDGDQSCEGNVAGHTLGTTFSGNYDWANMWDNCTPSSPEEVKLAVMDLCWEVAAALQTDFGHCYSIASTNYSAVIFPTYFGYADSTSVISRSNYTPMNWFNLLKAEINRDCPTVYRFDMEEGGHAVVCDGWRDTSSIYQYHINYGWSNTSYSDWYSIDDIAGSVNWATERAVIGISPHSTPTATPRPTNTPTPTSTSSQYTATPTPTSSQYTATPTPTPTSSSQTLTVDITMPSHFYHPGDIC